MNPLHFCCRSLDTFFSRSTCKRRPLGLLLFALLAGCATPPPTCDTLCQATQRRTQYLEQNPDLPHRVRAAVNEGKVVVGMSHAEVRAALGEPAQLIEGRPGLVTREQWAYRLADNTTLWVYFQFGRVHSWADESR